MGKFEFGKTGIVLDAKQGFGALPLQRISRDDAVFLLRKAYDNGFRYFDTARAYSDSEEKLGYAFKGIRENLFIATKTQAMNAEAFWKDLEMSLKMLQTDYIDVYQFHNPPFCPKPGGEDGLYDAMLEAKAQGKIRHIGITNHRLAVAQEAIDSGLYETLQFPFSILSGEPEMKLVEGCREKGMGFVAMKSLAGGLINNGYLAAAFMQEQDIVLPIWGVQRESELDEFIDCLKNGSEMTDEFRATIEKDRKELAGTFCRGCGYCMPCPVDISIRDCARMSLMLRRAPSASWLTEKWQNEMRKIENCLHCYQCASKCPYGLDTPEVLKANYDDYWKFLEAFNAGK
ncbi:MAG: aldo/keto reductase [Firmicutes bacterium]|nr:aldo/keto reductase [Bacillota bacterium]